MRLVPAALSVLLLAGACATDTDSTDESTQTSAATPTHDEPTAPVTTPKAASTPSEAASGAATTHSGTTTVPVYYLGATPEGWRLYREFRTVDGDPLETALSAAVGGRTHDGSPLHPKDPDYGSAWPGLTAAGGSFKNGIITVNLGGDPQDSLRNRPSHMTEREAELAIQQLVYTAQGVVQEPAPVVFEVWRERTDQVLGVPTAEPLTAGDPLSTLALVNVTTPEHGGTVSGSFVAEGVASSFEATVPWQLRQGKKVVLDGYATAEGWMDKLYPWKTEPIDVSGLTPGRYTFVAMTSDPSGGAEGSKAYRDTKAIIVE
jgi:hypothetical protein